MRDFLKNILEPLAFLIYTLAMIISLRKDRSGRQQVLLVHYIIATGLFCYATYLERTNGDNNWIYNTFHFLNICGLSAYFLLVIGNAVKKLVIKWLWVFNVCTFILFDVLMQRFLTYNPTVYAISSLSIIIYCLMFFHHIIQNVREANILTQIDFWLISGYLLYFLSSFFVIILYTSVLVNLRAHVWAIQNIILVFSALITLTGTLWMETYKQKSWELQQ